MIVKLKIFLIILSLIILYLFQVKEHFLIDHENYECPLPWRNYRSYIVGNKCKVNKSNILYKCGWSPFEGNTFKSRVTHTILNGQLVYNNFKVLNVKASKRLTFNR